MKHNKFLHTLESSWLCIRFPFLYPRNRLTGTHWQSRKLTKYMYGNRGICSKLENTKGIWDKAFQNDYDEEGHIHTTTKSYLWAIWYYIVYFIAEYVLSVFHSIPTYTELDAMPSGWRKAFGIQMCKELKAQLKKDKYLYKYRIIQIKEKFGYLHWYDEGASREVQDIISKYEDISYNTCIVCGNPSTKISSGWICPYCNEHFPKNSKVYQEKINGEWKTAHGYEMA